MSSGAGWYNGILASTVGVVFRAATGAVDPWTKQQQIDDEAAALVQASGGTTDISIATAQADNDITTTLISQNADPSQAGLRIPGLGSVGSADFLSNLETVVYGAIAVGVVIGGFYLYQAFGGTIKKTFRKRG